MFSGQVFQRDATERSGCGCHAATDSVRNVIGANLEEAQAASSRREFARYIQISLREARETLYWLRLCQELGLGSASSLESLVEEADQVARVLGSIAAKLRSPRRA